MDIQSLLPKLGKVAETGHSEWKFKAQCPAHDDKTASLSVGEDRNGNIMLKCFAGCATDEICAALGIEVKDLFVKNNSEKSKWEFVREHFYRDDNGEIIAKKVIYWVNGRKEPKWILCHYDGKPRFLNQFGKPQMGLTIGKSKVKIPLYNAHLLLNLDRTSDGLIVSPHGGEQRATATSQSNLDRPSGGLIVSPKGGGQRIIYIAEGEKDAETLITMGFLGTTTPNGAGEKWDKRFDKYVKGREVVILADNDAPGRGKAIETAGSIFGLTTGVKVVLATDIDPTVKEKGDISDIVAAHGLDTAKSMLEKAVNKAEFYKATKVEVGGTLDDVPTRKVAEIIPQIGHAAYLIDEIGLANIFADTFKSELRYCENRGVWMVYDGQKWIDDRRQAHAEEKCREFARVAVEMSKGIVNSDQRQAFYELICKLKARSNRDKMLKDAVYRHHFLTRHLDRNDNILNVQNGTLDLQTFELKPHNPDDLISKVAEVKYVQGAVCERWERFLDEIFESDKDLIRYVQQVFGYCLTGRANIECFFIFLGKRTRNGKSTLLKALSKLLGDYAGAVNAESIVERSNVNASAPSEDIARLFNLRFVLVSEWEKSKRMASSKVKQMTGGDELTARNLHENSFQFTPKFKLAINTNHEPLLSETTMFDSFRIKVIPFNRRFERDEQDYELKDMFLKSESFSGILNWCLEGLKIFRTEQLRTEPKAVKEATFEYQKQVDRAAQFMDECLKVNETAQVAGDEMYHCYAKWCDRVGYKFPMTKKNFYEELRKKNVKILERARINGERVCNIVVGFEVLPDLEFNRQPPSYRSYADGELPYG